MFLGSRPKLRNENNRNTGGLTLLDDGQGSEKQKGEKGSWFPLLKDSPAQGGGEGITRERKSWPGLPGREHSACHTPQAYDLH